MGLISKLNDLGIEGPTTLKISRAEAVAMIENPIYHEWLRVAPPSVTERIMTLAESGNGKPVEFAITPDVADILPMIRE